MRISDWSSDVCSSDLVLQGSPCFLPCHDDFGVGADMALLRTRKATPRQSGQTHHSPQQTTHHDGSPKQILTSEEHTSELQPLIRISYAVVCFKKKQDFPLFELTYRYILCSQPH